MENLVWLSTNGKEAMEQELLKGLDMANQLLELLTFDDKSNIIRQVKGSNSSSLSTLVAGDLVRQMLKSFTNTLLLLNNNQDSNHVSAGAYKKLKTLNTEHPKESNKRK